MNRELTAVAPPVDGLCAKANLWFATFDVRLAYARSHIYADRCYRFDALVNDFLAWLALPMPLDWNQAVVHDSHPSPVHSVCGCPGVTVAPNSTGTSTQIFW